MPRVLEICKSLDRSKYQPMVSVDHKGRLDNGTLEVLREIQVPVRILRMSPHPSAITSSSMELFKTVVEVHRIDASIQHSFDFSKSWSEPLISRLSGTAYWITEKANLDFSDINWKIKLLLASRIIVQSSKVKNLIVEKYPALDSKLTVIPQGVNTIIFRPQPAKSGLKESIGISPDSLVLGYIAHILPVKNHKDLFDAIYRTRNRKRIHLILVGKATDDQLKKQLDKKINDLGLEEQVHFLGLRTDISDICSIMDGIILTSTLDSLSNGILQGMACGLPVISSNVGGMADAVRPSINGWLVNMGQGFTERLSTAIDDWADDYEKRSRFGLNSLEIIKRDFTIEKMVQNYLLLYDNLK